jgi:dTDP-4-amino-4,6-dideoxygalactose transaminase
MDLKVAKKLSSSPGMTIPFHKPFLPCADLVCPAVKAALSNPDVTLESARMTLQKVIGHDAILTTSCTHALETMALLLDLQPGDEVILPSFTFVSTANAFALRGAKLVFADIERETMNLDMDQVLDLVSPNTKAVVLMHYGGVSCNWEKAGDLPEHITVLEDAAHAIGASYKGQVLGTLGDAGAWSFHHSKNIECGEGGALFIKDHEWWERAEEIVVKGTNKPNFDRGRVDAYTWQRLGSSYGMSGVQAAILGQALKYVRETTQRRKAIWRKYHDELQQLGTRGIELQNDAVIEEANGHIFFIKCRDEEDRTGLMTHLKDGGISAYFHYLPLHLSVAGKKYGSAPLGCAITESEASRLLRLPIYPDLAEAEQTYIIDQVKRYYARH